MSPLSGSLHRRRISNSYVETEEGEAEFKGMAPEPMPDLVCNPDAWRMSPPDLANERLLRGRADGEHDREDGMGKLAKPGHLATGDRAIGLPPGGPRSYLRSSSFREGAE